MLNLSLDTNINSLPFLSTLDRQKNIQCIIQSFIEAKNEGYDINDSDIQKEILDNFNVTTLSISEIKYIKEKVEYD